MRHRGDRTRLLSKPISQRNPEKSFGSSTILAEELGLPVVDHNRKAHADTLEMLSKFKGKINGIMHCFSGSKEMAEQCVKSDFYISFAGPFTFHNSHKLHECARMAKWTDLNKNLLETDRPWLASQEMRGKRNEPAFLLFIVEKIAELKGISMDELVEATTEDAKEIFELA